MISFLIVAATFCFVRGDLPSASDDLIFSCTVANDEIDQALTKSNFNIKSRGEDNMLVDVYGFEERIHLYAFGWKLPISVYLNVSNGNLTGINTLKRFTDATECSSPIMRTLEGIFEYGPDLSLRYDNATAKFIFWEIQGNLVYKPKPRMHVALLNGTLDCRFESISKESPGQSEFLFETDSSLMGWLISKLLVKGLRHKDDTSMESQVELWSQGDIASYFRDAWCSLDSPAGYQA